MREKLILHSDKYWISPYSFIVYVSLKEKKVDFDVHEINLETGEHKDATYQRNSYIGKVPCIQRGDFWLSESSAIVEFLEDSYPIPEHQALFPKDFKHRAHARMLIAWIRSSRDLLPLIEERSTATMFYDKGNPLSPKAKEAADMLIRVADRFIPSDKKNLFEDWCIADSDLAFCLHRLIRNGDPVPAKIKQYAEHQWQRPSVQEFLNRERAPYKPY